jgi:multidrug efflux pump subunit AcrB
MLHSRDMGAAFAVALLRIYILVVAQFGSPACLLVMAAAPLVAQLELSWDKIGYLMPFSASMIGFIALQG